MDYLKSRMRSALDDDDDEDDGEGEEEDGMEPDQEAQARRLSFPVDLHQISVLSHSSGQCELASEDSSHDVHEHDGQYGC